MLILDQSQASVKIPRKEADYSKKLLCLVTLKTHQYVKVHQLENQHEKMEKFYFKKFKASHILEVGGLSTVITLC